MTAWWPFSAVPGLAVPGLSNPALAGTGVTQQQWTYIGHIAVFYLDYLDVSTGHTLAVVPGGRYAMTPVNSRAGLTIPPPDHCWLTPSNQWAPRIVLRELAPVIEVPPPPQVLVLDALFKAGDALARARVRNANVQAVRASEPVPRQPQGSPRYAPAAPVMPSESALALAAARAVNARLQALRGRAVA